MAIIMVVILKLNMKETEKEEDTLRGVHFKNNLKDLKDYQSR